MAAVVAKKPLGRAVHSQRDATVWASHDSRALAAHDKRRIAASIEEQDALLSARESFFECLVEIVTNHMCVGRRRRSFARLIRPASIPQVDDVDARETTTTYYLPVSAFAQLSSEGVALPSTTTAPSMRARTIATSRA